MFLKSLQNLKVAFLFPSLMLMPQEQVQNTKDILQKPLIKDCIQVKGLIYQNPKNWILWIGDEKITSSDSSFLNEACKVVTINSEKVKLKCYEKKFSVLTRGSFNPLNGQAC